MKKINKLNILWMKTDADRKITFIINAKKCFLDKNIEINIKNNKFTISSEEDLFETEELPLLILNKLYLNNTTLIFLNENSEPFYKIDLNNIKKI